jgi:hypothetical protein
LESDLQADIGKVWRGVVHPEKSARVGLTFSRGLNGVHSDAKLRGERVTDKNDRAAGQGTQQERGRTGRFIGPTKRHGQVCAPGKRPVLHHGLTPFGPGDYGRLPLGLVGLGLPETNCLLDAFTVHALTYLSS